MARRWRGCRSSAKYRSRAPAGSASATSAGSISRRRARREKLALDAFGLGLDVVFQRGRPLVGRGTCTEVKFNDEPLGDLRVQVIRGDRILADGDEIDVG